MILHPPISTLFPYTTLFRSKVVSTWQAHATPVSLLAVAAGGGRLATAGGQAVPLVWDLRALLAGEPVPQADRKSTRLNSSHRTISYAVFCLKKKTSEVRLNH